MSDHGGPGPAPRPSCDCISGLEGAFLYLWPGIFAVAAGLSVLAVLNALVGMIGGASAGETHLVAYLIAALVLGPFAGGLIRSVHPRN